MSNPISPPPPPPVFELLSELLLFIFTPGICHPPGVVEKFFFIGEVGGEMAAFLCIKQFFVLNNSWV